MTFQELARAAQDKLRLTRSELAEKMGVNPYTFDSWMKSDDAASSREPPYWAPIYLEVLTKGKPITYVQGDIAITYQRKSDI